MKRGLLVALLLFLPFFALADGGVYRHKTAIATGISIADQRALICWSNGVERLAIETRFVGDGTNFAWVVPLPSEPAIEAATPGLFTTLDYIFQPKVVHEDFPLYALLLVCIGVGYLLLYVRRNTEPRHFDILVSVLIALAMWPISGCTSVFLAVLLPYVVWRIRRGKESWWAILIAVVFALILSGMLLPALATKRAAISTSSEVSVLERKIVGVYDTATIASKNPRAILDWLNENDYVVPNGIEKVVSNYVQRGWVFVAARLQRDSSNRTPASPHPLCFTFASDKPVYPMQLTAIGNTNLSVDLFVFGPSRAEAGNFRTDKCSNPIFTNPSEHYIPKSGGRLRIAHPLLRKWVSGSETATKLSAALRPEQMDRDVEIRWVPFKETERVLYSKQGAITFAINWGTAAFAACLLFAVLITAFKHEWQKALPMITLAAALLCAAVALIIYVSVPKITVKLVSLPAARSANNLRMLGLSLVETTNTHSLDDARRVLQTLANQVRAENILLGGPMREEDSPGNYVLRESTNEVEFFWYDADGGEHSIDKQSD